jgi:hypothetical protein
MRFLGLLLLVLTVALPGAAQPGQPADDAPLLLWSAGDFYLADAANPANAPIRLTSSGVISGAVLSPQGGRVAYREAAAVGLDALGRLPVDAPIAEFDLPSDIIALDLVTGAVIPIALQSPGASLFVEGVPNRADVRSAPSWSPDGTQLAWTSLAFESPAAQLYLFDFNNLLTAVVPINVPVQRGAAPEVIWGRGGIAVGTGEPQPGERAYSFFTPDGFLRSTTVIRPATGEAIELVAWVEDGADSLFGTLFSSGRWALIDPATGTERSVEGVPQLVSALNPDQSLALRFGVDGELGFFWETLDPLNAQFSGAFPSAPERTTLSPSGRAVSFLGYPSYTGAALWTETAGVQPIAGTGSGQLETGNVFWGPTIWRLGPILADPAAG